MREKIVNMGRILKVNGRYEFWVMGVGTKGVYEVIGKPPEDWRKDFDNAKFSFKSIWYVRDSKSKKKLGGPFRDSGKLFKFLRS